MLRRKSCKTLAVLALFALLFNVFGAGVSVAKEKSAGKLASKQMAVLQHKNLTGTKMISYNVKGIPRVVQGPVSTHKVDSFATALSVVQENKDLFRLQNATEEFTLLKQISDNLGKTYKLQQVYQGVPVFGHQLIVHADKNGNPTSINGNYDPDIHSKGLDTKAKLSAAAALKAAKKAVGLDKVTKFDISSTQLYIYIKNNTNYLAYQTVLSTLEGGKAAYWQTFINAQTGSVIAKQSLLKDSAAVGTGQGVLGSTRTLNTNYVSGTYYLQDITKPMAGISTYTAQNGTSYIYLMSDTDNNWTDPAAVDAHYYTGKVWDYYKSKFNLNSYDGAGGSLKAVVHYDSRFNNAFWAGDGIIAYGDGDGSLFRPLSGALDVIGHEFTHGVVETYAGLIYDNQSGALDESVADVFGNLIENKPDNLWLVGEDVYTPSIAGDALRSMSNPRTYNQPDNMANYQNLPDTPEGDYGGVHVNSGIPNKAFFNVVNSGVSRDDAGKIWYRALTNYLFPIAEFADARYATILAANDLFGQTSPQATAVKNAWTSVGVIEPDRFEPNDSPAAAYGPIASGTTYNGYISSLLDADWFKFTTAASGPVSVSLTNLLHDYDVYLFDANGAKIGYSENVNENPELISLASVPSGTYYIAVFGYDGYSTTQPYALKATFTAQQVPGQLQFTSGTYSVSEAGGSATITVKRVNGSSGTVAVNYTTSNGTASAGSDYTAKSGTLTFSPGVTTQTFSVPISNDSLYEGNETVNLTLSNPSGGASLGSISRGTLTIVDNDTALMPRGVIEQPAVNQTIRGSIDVKGWYLDGSGFSKLEVFVDNTYVGQAIYGDLRTDVYNVFPAYNNRNSGYHFNLNTRKLSNGTHSISVLATNRTNRQLMLGSKSVVVSNVLLPTRGVLESPAANATVSGTVQLKGWALDPGGVSRIDVLVDRNTQGTATYGLTRTDVYSVFPQYNNRNSGFTYNLNTAALSRGTHTITLIIRSNDGTPTYLLTRSINVTSGTIIRTTITNSKDYRFTQSAVGNDTVFFNLGG